MTHTASSPAQRDIARHAGVSQAAVSMVLNGRAEENRIPLATQERIQAAIAELGYVPNVAARALRGRRNGLLGVHTFERVFPVNPVDYYHEFLVGIEEQAVESGMDLVLFASTQKPDGTRSIYRNSGNRLSLADGVIMLGFEKNDGELRQLRSDGIPFVFIGRREVPGIEIPCITANYAEAAASIVEMLRLRNHQEVLYLAAEFRGSTQRERLNGFEVASVRSGLKTRIMFVDPAEEMDTVILSDALEQGVTAVIAETFGIGRALHRALDALGLAVPGDFSVVCLDTDPEGGAQYSHLDVPRRAMGRAAVSLLLDVLNEKRDNSAVEVVPCGAPTMETVAAAPPARLNTKQ